MTFTEIQLFQILKTKLGEKEAEQLVSFIETKVKDEFDAKRDSLATKEDLVNTKAEIIKWMFLFWIGQIGVTLGIIYAYIKN
ncbi:hypothetical protein I5M32_06985 [Pedobacter sp. SD-b]|uniref:Haemolysin XhlA n=1 Tax=Pedobacter segetis TaxID=2793069 RepID=A0ABS1BII9_9SPHI|nr:hypothetical protein [Pedobacter segetis]MBK0382699.1 hypothetical protein [Pedobacter segetis]